MTTIDLTATPIAKALAKQQAKAKREALEAAMLLQIKAVGLTRGLVQQHRFHPERKWAFDFAYPERKWALEVEGGTWAKSRHTTGAGFRDDCEKYAAAALAGWRVLRATSDQVKNGTAIGWLEQALKPKALPGILATLDKTEPGELANPKERPVRSPKYLREVALLPCANCRREGVSQAAHINRGKGMAIKAPDNHTFPLCATGSWGEGCHVLYDQYKLADKHASAEMGEDWAKQTYNTLKRAGKVPMGVPAPRF